MRFIMVDRYESYEPGVRATGIKAITGSEDFLADHFPGNPVMPGVLTLEAMAQTAGGLLTLTDDFRRFGLMTLVHSGKFRDFARPGHLLRCEVEITSMEDASARVSARAIVEDRVIASATLGFVLVPMEEIIGSIFVDSWVQHIRGWAGLEAGG